MALNLRQKQTSLIVRMLNLNQSPSPGGGISSSSSAAAPTTAEGEEVYKILIMDGFCRSILSPLIRVNDLRSHGVTLFFGIDKERQRVPDVPALYFVRPTPENVDRIAADASRALYDSLHLNFSSSLPRPLLDRLASRLVESGAADRVSRVFDQYLEFVSLEDALFSLAQPRTYVHINDPAAGTARSRRSSRGSWAACSACSPRSASCP
uniref:SEC1 family transport protein SLY1 n=1 Tax=Ananas comosus var. bracteatus TaxID=296719 RepID=A0A6V7NRU7_ANACO|nr:unnamed protein product [Ananas comosus var. bracteatus]